jgi:hypothetical protein
MKNLLKKLDLISEGKNTNSVKVSVEPRNFVAKNAKTAGAGRHKNEKETSNTRREKHKNSFLKDIHVEESATRTLRHIREAWNKFKLNELAPSAPTTQDVVTAQQNKPATTSATSNKPAGSPPNAVGNFQQQMANRTAATGQQQLNDVELNNQLAQMIIKKASAGQNLDAKEQAVYTSLLSKLDPNKVKMNEEDPEPELYDSVDIELNEHFVIETGIVGFTDDGIVVEADETSLAILELGNFILEETELMESKPGLWANIHAKRKRIKSGSGERMRSPNSKGAPSSQDFKDAAKTSEVNEAEYQGRKVPLGKPMKGDVKKSKVYVKKPNGKVVKVNFGDKNMRIKKSNPKRRKSFRARHNCSNPGPRWKAKYWSCRAW